MSIGALVQFIIIIDIYNLAGIVVPFFLLMLMSSYRCRLLILSCQMVKKRKEYELSPGQTPPNAVVVVLLPRAAAASPSHCCCCYLKAGPPLPSQDRLTTDAVACLPLWLPSPFVWPAEVPVARSGGRHPRTSLSSDSACFG